MANHLYWFGGYMKLYGPKPWIEFINVSNIEHITFESWQRETSLTLHYGRTLHKSVLFNGFIYNIGGSVNYLNDSSDVKGYSSNLVERFDVDTRQNVLDTSLPGTMNYPCVVQGDDVIFVAYAQQLYWATPGGVTLDPTIKQTCNPTNDPTIYPTFGPTISTSAPTINPTVSPIILTIHPSQNPSHNPTNYPSKPTIRLQANHRTPSSSPTYASYASDYIVSTEKQSSVDDKGNPESDSSADVGWIIVTCIIGSVVCGILIGVIYCTSKRSIAGPGVIYIVPMDDVYSALHDEIIVGPDETDIGVNDQ
eukprot:1135151_1